jgi:UDP-3-O-[3-hydroxymyristoyl] glucosamine N-acyltransferase
VPGVRLPTSESVLELSRRLGGAADESAREARIERLVAPDNAAAASDLVIVLSPRLVARALERPGTYLVQEALASRLPEGRRWVHPRAELALAELLSLAAPPPRPPARAASAVVEAGAELGADVDLAPGAVLMAGARIGSGARIGPNAVIYSGVEIGRRVVVGALCVIGRPGFGFVSGPDGRMLRVPQLGGVVIEDDVEIGALSSVDAGTLGPTRIGAGAKLDAHVHVGHNVEIGPGCLVAAQAGFAGSVRLGSGVLVGGQAGVKDHASIGDGARIAAKSGVIGDVPPGVTVAGFPAVPRVRWLRAMAKLLGRSGVENPR